jgi:hypothetical protein
MPFDKHGDAVIPGSLYAIGRGTKLLVSETRYDVDADVLLIRRYKSGESWVRADEIDSDLVWVPCDAEGNEVTRDSIASCDDPRDMIRQSVLRARVLKDQLAAIEAELLQSLQAVGDSELCDAVMQAIHGDGSVEAVLQLVES